MTRTLRPQIKLLTVIFLVSVLFIADVTSAQRRSTQSSATQPKRPRLVLLIVVDQFRYDYLERFGDLFGPNGLKRLLSSGALFTNANYDYVPTFTACGHAAIF